MRQFFLLVPLLLLLGCSGKTEVVTHYPDGMIKSKGYFDADGRKTGEWVEWFPSGRIKVETKWKSGRVIEKHGLYTVWYDSGQKKSETGYNDNYYEGKHIEWYDNGQKKAETTFANSKKNGWEYTWHRNGNLETQGAYTFDKREGWHQRYYENGVLYRENLYENAFMRSKTLLLEKKVYDDDGKIMEHAQYKRGIRDSDYVGLRHGTQKEWGLYGGLTYHAEYKDGELIKTIIDTRLNK